MSVITIRRTVVRREKGSTNRQSTYELTRRFFAHERSWEFLIEAVLFAILLVASAWPIAIVADVLNEFLQRTTI